MSLLSVRRRLLMDNICSVTFHLDGLTTSAPNQVFNGMPYTATFTVLDNKTFLPSTVRVLMGGIEVTDNTFDFESNTIFISSVTGNVEITAEAQTISSTLLSTYEILPYIGEIDFTGSPGLPFTTILPTEKTKLYVSIKMKRPSGYLIMQRGQSLGSPYPELAMGDQSGYGRLCWAGRRSGGLTKFDTYRNNRMDIWCDRGVWDIYCKSMKVHRTHNYAQEGDTFTATRNLTIMGNTTSTSEGSTLGDVYELTHWSDDVLTHRYIPVKRISDKKVGMLDINGSNSFVLKDSTYWVAPYISITNTCTNCTATRLSTAETGFASYMVIGKQWQFKYTPTAGYTFANNGLFRVLLNGVDVTSTAAVYDSTTGTYTVTLTAHWKDNVNIRAIAAMKENAYNLDGVELSVMPRFNQPYIASFNGINGKTLLPNTVKIEMSDVDITENVFNNELNRIEIDNVTGNLTISAKGIVVPNGYVPIQYIRNTNLVYNSTKYRYFDTGYHPTDLTVVEHDFNFLAQSNNGGLMGAGGYEGTPFFAVGCTYSDLERGRIAWGNVEYTAADYTLARNLRQTVTFGKGTLTCKNISKVTQTKTIASTLATPWTSSKTFTIGGFQHSANVYRVAPLKLYGCKIYEDTQLQQDWVPFIRTSDNYVGFYDIENDTFITEKTDTNTERCDWIRPYVGVTRTLTNCTQSMLTGLLASGNASMAIIGETWSSKFTPSTDYTFNDSNAVFTVLINDVDVTSTAAVYDSTTDTYTVTLTAHWNDVINITATAVTTIV